MFKIFITFSLLSILSSCSNSNPFNKTFSDKDINKDAEDIINSKELTNQELKALGDYIIDSKIQEKDLSNMTYKEILLKSKEYIHYHRTPSDEEFRKRDKFDTKLSDKTNFIRYRRSDDGKAITIEMKFENKSEKAVKSEIGSLGIPDLGLNDKENLSIIFENAIQPKETKFGLITIPFNPFNSDQKTIGREWSENVKFRWLPTKIIFEDGSEY